MVIEPGQEVPSGFPAGGAGSERQPAMAGRFPTNPLYMLGGAGGRKLLTLNDFVEDGGVLIFMKLFQTRARGIQITAWEPFQIIPRVRATSNGSMRPGQLEWKEAPVSRVKDPCRRLRTNKTPKSNKI